MGRTELPSTERAQAIEWLVTLPAGPQITHRVLPDAGVVIVEVKEPLRVQDSKRWPT